MVIERSMQVNQFQGVIDAVFLLWQVVLFFVAGNLWVMTFSVTLNSIERIFCMCIEQVVSLLWVSCRGILTALLRVGTSISRL